MLTVRVLEGAAVVFEGEVDGATTVGDLVAQLPPGAAPVCLAQPGAPVPLDTARALSSLTKSPGQVSDDGSSEFPTSVVDLVVMHAQKGRCVTPGCGERVARVVGECRYCGGGFCGRHRLPEAHACAELGSCREESHARNSSRLLEGKCVADKV